MEKQKIWATGAELIAQEVLDIGVKKILMEIFGNLLKECWF